MSRAAMKTKRTPQGESIRALAMTTVAKVEALGIWAAYLLERLPDEEQARVAAAIRKGTSPRMYEEGRRSPEVVRSPSRRSR